MTIRSMRVRPLLLHHLLQVHAVITAPRYIPYRDSILIDIEAYKLR